MELTEYQYSYLAGLIDGEGSLESQREWQPKGATPRFVLRISFTFATEEPLRTVCEWLGISYKCYPATDETRSPRYRAHVPKGVTVPLLEGCLPYLILKKRQAELILAIEDVRARNSPDRRHFGFTKLSRMPVEAVNEMILLHDELRSLKNNKRRLDARVNRVA